jgi:hypothetical protein
MTAMEADRAVADHDMDEWVDGGSALLASAPGRKYVTAGLDLLALVHLQGLTAPGESAAASEYSLH